MGESDDDCFGDGAHGDHETLFEEVLQELRLENLAGFALSIRKSQVTAASSACSHCEVIKPPLFGSYHILFVVRFDDGIRWILRVSAKGCRGRFNTSAAHGLTSEALTMQLLKRSTTIPIPTIFSFDASSDNDLNCPFILMEYIQGFPLSDRWFDKDESSNSLGLLRIRVLKELAAAMSQLKRFRYDMGGSPVFDEAGEISGIGPTIRLDCGELLRQVDFDGSNEHDVCEIEPFADARSFFLCMIDRREPPKDKYSQGIYLLLRLFIDWIPYNDLPEGFVLAHPDLNPQNILISEDGALTGIIDWDGVATVPAFYGNGRYPSWLTRDWDPAMYTYGLPSGGHDYLPENSPEELSHYREVYAEALNVIDGEATACLTRKSLLLESLEIAANDPVCTHRIVRKIFDEIVLATEEDASVTLDGASADTFHDYEVVCALVDGKLDKAQMNRLKEGFSSLFSSL